jgi:RNA polymerase sigma factor (sigma-70 family)
MGQAMTDAELVAASRRGEHDAFGALVERYQDVVCAVSYSSTGNWALSDDVAQDTFLAAWRQLAQLRDGVRVRSWLCAIARNLARKARKRGDRETVVDEDLPAEAASPYDATARAQVERVVHDALARIPATYREALVLYYCDSRSIREIAEALGIAEDAAAQRLARGRRHLAGRVTELVEDSLRSPRTRRALAPCVLAALPTHVETSPPAEGSIMWKLVLVSVAAVAVGTTGYVVHRARGDNAAAPDIAAPSPGGAVARSDRAAPALAAPAAPTRAEAAKLPAPIAKATLDRVRLARGPSRGPADARVTIVVFQDMICPYCGHALGTIDQLFDEYPGELRLVVKQYPVHAQARLAAEASYAADAQGKFWELHDAMMQHQDDLSRDALLALGKQVGLDVDKLADALDHHTYANAVAADVAAGKDVGVRGTPAFVIGDREFDGARPIEYFRAAIDAALAESP